MNAAFIEKGEQLLKKLSFTDVAEALSAVDKAISMQDDTEAFLDKVKKAEADRKKKNLPVVDNKFSWES